MTDCLFCEIVNGNADYAKIWENKEFLAVLDTMPNTKGMALVLPKKHYDSYAFDMPDKEYLKLMAASEDAAKILENGLGVARVMEGMGIDHAHIKLDELKLLADKIKNS